MNDKKEIESTLQNKKLDQQKKNSFIFSLFKHFIYILIWVSFIDSKFNVIHKIYSDFVIPQYFLSWHNLLEIMIFASIIYIFIIEKRNRIWAIFKSIRFIVNLFIYPLIFIKKIFDIWKKFAILIKTPRRLELQMISMGLYIYSIYILYSKNWNIWFGIVGILFSLTILWISMFLWVLEPFQLVKRWGGFLMKIYKNIYFWIQKHSKDKRKIYDDFIPVLSEWRNNISKDKKHIIDNLIQGFLSVFIIVIIVTIVGFAVIYHKMQIKCNGEAIKGITYSFKEAIYFSALTFSNMDFGNISPINGWVKIFSIIEIYVSMYLLVLVILVFNMVSPQKASEALDEMLKAIDKLEKEMKNKLKEENSE